MLYHKLVVINVIDKYITMHHISEDFYVGEVGRQMFYSNFGKLIKT